MEKDKLRPVEVTIGHDSFKGVFHGWTEKINCDVEGHVFTYKLAMIEKSENGEMIEVEPEKIRFID